jgi:hypothetical protein
MKSKGEAGTMKSIVSRILLLSLISVPSLFLAGCDKTKLIDSWADPNAADYRFTKPIVVVFIDHEEIRETAEEAIVRNVEKVQAYPSYIVLQEGELKDTEKAKARLREDGYDGAIVLRLLGIEDRTSYSAAPSPLSYQSYYDYYNTAWLGAAYTKSYINEERIIRLETALFSITDDKPLWVGVSESKNPETVSNLIDEIAEVIGKELRKKGITQ